FTDRFACVIFRRDELEILTLAAFLAGNRRENRGVFAFDGPGRKRLHLVYPLLCRRAAGVCAPVTRPSSIALSVRSRCLSPYSKSWVTRSAWRPPSKPVSTKISTRRSIISHPVRRSERASTLASLCRRA